MKQYDGLFYTPAERLTNKTKISISRASPSISKEIENGEGSNATMTELTRRPSTGNRAKLQKNLSPTIITRRPSTGSGASITRHSSSDDLSR